MSHDRITRKGVFYVVFCIAATICATVFNFFLMWKNSDITNVDGVHVSLLYKSGFMTSAFIVFLLIAVAVFLSSLLLYKKHVLVSAKRALPVLIFLRAAAGLLLILLIVMQFTLKTAGTPYALNDQPFSLQNSSSVQKAALVLAGLGCFFFFIPIFAPEKNKTARVLTVASGLFLVFFLCAQLLVTHEYMSDFLNSPVRVFSICTYCALVFFFLSLIRLSLQSRAIPAAFAATGMIAFFCSFTENVPEILLSVMNAQGFSIGIGTVYGVFKLTSGLFALLCVIPTLLYARKAQTCASPSEDREVLSPEEGQSSPSDKTPESPEDDGATPREKEDGGQQTEPEQEPDPEPGPDAGTARTAPGDGASLREETSE